LKDDWLNRYTLCAASQSGPETLHFANGLWLLSACIGPHPLMLWRAEIYPNLSILNLAPSGENKSGALSFARRILPSDIYVYPTGLTPEALIRDELSKHPEGVYGRDEYSVLLALANTPIYSQGLNQIIAQIQDGYPNARLPDRNTLLAHKVNVGDMCVTFFGATTLSLFLQNVNLRMFENGHLPRWLLVVSKRSDWVPLRQPEYRPDDSLCVGEVHLDLEMLHHNRPSDYRYDDDALERMNDWMQCMKERKYAVEDPIEQAIMSKWCFVVPHKLSVVMEVSHSIKETPIFKGKTKNVSSKAVDRAIDYIEKNLAMFKTEILPLIQ